MTTTNTPTLCPNCGYNFTRDTEIVTGRWRLVPRDGVYYDGVRVGGLTAMQVDILHSIAKSGESAISAAALGNRHSDSADASAVIRVMIHRIRSALEAQGIEVPFEAIMRRGYRWINGWELG